MWVCYDEYPTTVTTTTSTSTTTITTTTGEPVGKGVKTIIVGTLVLTVPDAVAFISDVAARDAVSNGIADAVKVSHDYVTLTVTPWTGKNRRMRRLAEAVTVEYTITIPAGASSISKLDIPKRVLAITAGELTAAIQKTLITAKGHNYIVTVDSKTVPKVTTSVVAPVPTSASLYPVRYHWLICMTILFACFLR